VKSWLEQNGTKKMNSAQIQQDSLATFSRCRRMRQRRILKAWRNWRKRATLSGPMLSRGGSANDPDVSEVTTRQVPEDDVPAEYLNDQDEHVA
jgi:hypothetical protein